MRGDLISVDLGCGGLKRPGTVGVDVRACEGVDHVVDFLREPLPFADDSVGYVFSSHCIEHLTDPLPLFREIGRVCSHGAKFELWTPYAWHNDAMLLGHVTQWTHEFYVHVSGSNRPFWTEQLGVPWVIDEVVHVVQADVQRELAKNGFDVPFAVQHLVNVVTEMGVLGRVDKSGTIGSRMPKRTYAASRGDSDAGRRHPLDPPGSLLARVRRAVGRVVSGAR